MGDAITAKLPLSSWAQRKLLQEAYPEPKDPFIEKFAIRAFQKYHLQEEAKASKK